MLKRSFRAVLVANRGEIAIRVFRACNELGVRTLGIYSNEDKTALHRYKADETYLVGEGQAPLQAYLGIEEILTVAKRRGADAIHPGYGFLSENPAFARACEEAGIVFIGPPSAILEQMGDKVAARARAQSLGIPVIPGTPEPLPDDDAAVAAAEAIGFPVILKASFGGGGRGMRVAHDARALREQFAAATQEAAQAFGRGDIFLEKYLVGPRHVEVQVLGDAHGSVVHLFERDCSVQRRHQKVIEIAPAPFLAPDLRQKLCEAALTLARAIGYVNAGTVEFLIDQAGDFYFIEMNPRIQVEHTVTEMITGVDIVKSQIRIAEGVPLSDPQIGLPQQSAVQMRGYAVQCRITTEDPANQFTPDYGRITHYRSPAGFGIRLDGATAFTGAIITPFYDSLLVKLTAWSLDFGETCQRLQRALSEFRVHGVKTNIPFLQNVVAHPTFQSGGCTTTFIEETPGLFQFPVRRDRASRILEFVGEITVNGNPTLPAGREGEGARGREGGPLSFAPSPRRPVAPSPVVPAYDPDTPAPAGTRQRFLEMGPEKFGHWVRQETRLLITDTTFRDAHQSLLATRVRTFDLLRIAPAIARQLPQLFSMEMWGGATFDVAMRFLHECPWERLAQLREAVPNILFQMLLRGANAVGYTNYPTNVVRRFTKEAFAAGIDLFRIFDSLNYVPAMAPAIEAAREAGALAEAAICYTADLFDPKRPRYHLQYYVELAKELEGLGANLLAIKDMAGLCRPYAARRLVEALRQEVAIPIHFHTHDTAGGQIASLLMAAEAGVDIVDAAISAMAGLTSQPCLETLVAALERQPRDTGLDWQALMPHAEYWRVVRGQYAPFETDLRAPAADVYLHEIPGGQYSNLRPQAEAMGVGDRIPELKRMYAVVNEMLGDIVKVTPSSKVVGDLAIYMMTHHLTPDELIAKAETLQFPESVIGFFAGEIGIPPGGFPERLRRAILKDRADTENAEPALVPVDFDAVRAELAKKLFDAAGPGAPPVDLSEQDLLSYLMYPRVFLGFQATRAQYGDISPVPTEVFFYGLQPGEETEIEIEEGKTLFIKLIALTAPDEHGMRTLFFELNGNPREVRVRDQSAGVTVVRRAQADPGNLHHLGAPMPGAIQEIAVKPGDAVEQGDRLLTLEAMKVFMYVTSPLAATVKEILVAPRDHVERGDLLVVFE
jgi:pyruvate carboxylase